MKTRTIIAKTIKGSEYVYSRINCFSVSKQSCNLICKALNDVFYNLKDNEQWKIYTVSDFDFSYTHAVFQRLTYRKGRILIQNYSSVLPGGNWN